MRENFSVGQRRFNRGPGPVHYRPGKSRPGLRAGGGTKVASRSHELSIVITSLIGWGMILLKVGLSTGVSPKEFAVAVAVPLLVGFAPLCILGRLGKKGGQTLCLVWGVFVTLVVFAVWAN